MKIRLLITYLFIFLLFVAMPVFSAEKTINLNVDERYWYPFTYIENDQAKGMHVDIVKEALKNLGYQVNIAPLPRKRCMSSAQEKGTDGIISIAYSSEIAKFLEFPTGSEKDQESPFRIMQVDHMVITNKVAYEFEGNPKTLPSPVRLPRGETMVADLEKDGIQIEEARTDEQNFEKLIRDKNGSVITTSVIAENMNQNPKLKDKFIIHPSPIASQSYFIAFSPKSALTSEEKIKIWNEIAKLRNDYVFMLKLFAQY